MSTPTPDRPPHVPETPHAAPRAAVSTPPSAQAAGGTLQQSAPSPAALATAVAAPAVRVPGYEVLEELGRGGMGVVYKARQVALNRVVALKMILSGEHAGEKERLRFKAEAQALARLQHPHIVQIHDIGVHDGRPYFSMEFVEGGSLDRKLKGTPAPPRQAASIVETLARAVHAAHEAGVVHRDLKPANVLVGKQWTLKITDFGLAKKLDEAGQTRVGAQMGTPSYMAPEQAAGKSKEVGPAADVYALGAILYECLTGRPPFKAATVLETMRQVVEDEPVPPRQLQPKTPRDLETICLKCLQKEPKKRYTSAEALAEDLRRFQAGEPITARPVGTWERAAKWVRRRPAVAGFMALFVVSLLLGTAVSTCLAVVANERAGQAEKSDLATKTALHNVETEQQNTAAALVKVKEEQQNTAEALARAEEALAIGLLRPIGHDYEKIDIVEWNTVWEVATLPKEQDRVRVLFVDEALNRPETAEQLACRSPIIVHAAVGLDRERRAAVLRRVLPRLRDKGADWRVRMACAAVIAELVPPDDECAAEAAQALLDAVIKTKIGKARASLLQKYQALVKTLSLPDAKASADFVLRAMDSEPNSSRRDILVAALAAIAPRMDAAQFPAAIEHALGSTDEGLDAQSGEGLPNTVVALLPHMDEALVRRTEERILSAMDNQLVPPYRRRYLAETLAALAPRMDEAMTAKAANAILGTMAEESMYFYRPAYAAALAVLVPRLREAQVRSFTEMIGSAMDDATKSPIRKNYAAALGALGSRMNERSAEAVTELILFAMEREDSDLDTDCDAFPTALAMLVPRMREVQAVAAADRVIGVIEEQSNERDPKTALSLATHTKRLTYLRALEAFAPHLDAKRTHAVTESLLTAADKDVGGRGADIAATLAALLARMSETESRAAAEVVVQATLQDPDPYRQASLVRAMAMLGPRMDDLQAHTATERILETMDKESSPYRRVVIAQALSALAPRMEKDEASKAVPMIVDTVVRCGSVDQVRQLADDWETITSKITLQERINILNGPACVGEMRAAVLSQIGRLSHQEFHTLWDLVDWLEANHPDIDILSPPKRPHT